MRSGFVQKGGGGGGGGGRRRREEVVGGVVGWAAADCYDGYRNNPR